LNDLWKYNITTGEWTWVHGTNGFATNGVYGTKGTPAVNNIPGGRGGALYHGGNPVSWVDNNGNFWVFGGHGYGATGSTPGPLNDLWRFNPTTGQWTWMSGTDQVNDLGNYGILGQPAPTNVPRARFSAIAWKDPNDIFYLFGGMTFDAQGNTLYLNDLWTYNPSNNTWTWINGSSQTNEFGNYGTMGIAAATNQPGARGSLGQPTGFHDAFGKFWLYGGLGFSTQAAGSTATYLSDLWQYDPATNMWTWMKGPDPNTNPHFADRGTQKVRAATNRPASKYAHCTWTDLNGNFWLMGGITRVIAGIYQDRPTNDLWRLDQVAVPPRDPIYTQAPPHVCLGDTGIVYTVNTIPNATTYEWEYTGTGVTLRDGPTTTLPSNRLDIAANATSGLLRVRAVNLYGNSNFTDTLITVNPVPVVNLGPDIDTCGVASLTLNASVPHAAATYTWSTGATTPTISVTDSARYWVTVDINGCKGNDTINAKIIPVAVNLGPDTAVCDYDLPFVLTSQQRPDMHFVWSNGLSTREMEVTRTGRYWLEISYNNCKASDTIHIEVVKSPDVFIGDDTTICAQFPLTIGDEIAGFSHTWNTGATTPFINVNQTGTYVLEVSRLGCFARDTIDIVAMPVPPVYIGSDGDICENQTLVLDATLPDAVTYQWNTGEQTPSISVSDPGLYHVTVTTVHNCVGKDSIRLSLYPDPIVFLPQDTVVCVENPLEIIPSALNTESFRWSDGSTGKTLTVMTGGTYIVTAINKCATASDTIVVDPIYCDIWAPNAFSPNGDGRNDVFRVRGNLFRISGFGLSVFNRWGERVYHSFDRNQGWDGTFKGNPADIGTYTYVIEYQINGKPYQQKGTFELVR
jgi:gliding motility-associated-like protein